MWAGLVWLLTATQGTAFIGRRDAYLTQDLARLLATPTRPSLETQMLVVTPLSLGETRFT